MESALLCSTTFLFLRMDSEKNTIVSEGCMSFITQQGFFAALGHNEEDTSIPYLNAELFAQSSAADEPIQAGRVLVSRSTGVYGALYDDYAPPVVSYMPVAALTDIEVGAMAELWLPDQAGKPTAFTGRIVALFPEKLHPVLFDVTDDRFLGASFGSSGSVVVQNGKIAAVVAGANNYPAQLLYCTSAEQMMLDLKAMIHNFSMLESEEDF